MTDHGTPSRRSHPCLDRRCGHPSEEHVATPELAAGGESVAWCMRCRRHEVRGPSWAAPFRFGLHPRPRSRASRPA
ncbi:MAG: hypothetical protein L3K10_06375 [Thermoplasmata archaeon]|nr:hypothetical protein [Thermoplasmata archaeon]